MTPASWSGVPPAARLVSDGLPAGARGGDGRGAARRLPWPPAPGRARHRRPAAGRAADPRPARHRVLSGLGRGRCAGRGQPAGAGAAAGRGRVRAARDRLVAEERRPLARFPEYVPAGAGLGGLARRRRARAARLATFRRRRGLRRRGRVDRRAHRPPRQRPLPDAGSTMGAARLARRGGRGRIPRRPARPHGARRSPLRRGPGRFRARRGHPPVRTRLRRHGRTQPRVHVRRGPLAAAARRRAGLPAHHPGRTAGAGAARPARGRLRADAGRRDGPVDGPVRAAGRGRRRPLVSTVDRQPAAPGRYRTRTATLSPRWQMREATRPTASSSRHRLATWSRSRRPS